MKPLLHKDYKRLIKDDLMIDMFIRICFFIKKGYETLTKHLPLSTVLNKM